MQTNDQTYTTELLANEQTYLAWLRTGVEVMAFGFVAIKFSLFASQIMGLLLVGCGALMLGFSYFRYRSTVRKLRQGQYAYETLLLTAVSAVLLLISAVLLICLIDVYVNSAKGTAAVAKKQPPSAELTE